MIGGEYEVSVLVRGLPAEAASGGARRVDVRIVAAPIDRTRVRRWLVRDDAEHFYDDGTVRIVPDAASECVQVGSGARRGVAVAAEAD